MLASKGNQGTGVDRKQPVMRRMELFSWEYQGWSWRTGDKQRAEWCQCVARLDVWWTTVLRWGYCLVTYCCCGWQCLWCMTVNSVEMSTDLATDSAARLYTRLLTSTETLVNLSWILTITAWSMPDQSCLVQRPWLHACQQMSVADQHIGPTHDTTLSTDTCQPIRSCS